MIYCNTCPRAHNFKAGIPCNRGSIFKMNYTTTLIFAFALFARFASCSEGDYNLVCKTDYSHVLKQFSRSARHFQDKLEEVKACLDPSVNNRAVCLNDTKISRSYQTNLLESHVKHDYLTAENVNNLHKYECNDLIWYALNKKYVKDIPLKEYNVLIESAVIETLLNSISIGIKVKTNKSEVLKKFGKFTNLMSNNFAAIKACLGDDMPVNKEKFCECISALDIDSSFELSCFLASLPEDVTSLGGPKVVDDIDLKIELNRYLNMMPKYSYDEDDPSDMILREYSSNLSNEQIDGLKNQIFIWFLIKACGGVLAVAVLVVLVAYFYKKKTATVDDEEKVDSEP